MEVESSVQMEGIPSTEALFSEHNYFKKETGADEVELMETAECASPPNPTSESLSLTHLDSSKDTFETCLIQLLHAYTTSQRGTSPSSAASTPQSVGGASGGGEGTAAPMVDISPESLSSLSAEQVSVLVTSNSVNYEVIQQIMAQKQGYQGIPMRTASLLALAGNNGGGLLQDGNAVSGGRNSGQSSRQETPDGASPSPTAGGGGGGVANKSLLDDAPPVGSPLGLLTQQLSKNPLVQITSEQLQLLQQQVFDLLRSKHVYLPPEMTSQEKQMLIQNALLNQLQLQQQGQVKEKQGASGSTGSSGVSTSASNTPPPPTSSSAATNVKESSVVSNTTSSTAVTSSDKDSSTLAAAVKQESSASLTLGSILSSSKVTSQPAAVEVKKEKRLESPDPGSQFTPSSSSLPDNKPSPATLPLPPPPVSSTATKQPPHNTPSQSPASTSAATKTSSTPAPASSAGSSPPATRASASKSGGGGSRRKKGDSNKNEPKKPPMPYNIFFSEVYSTVLAANSKMTFADASKIISMMWNAMGTDVKQKYYERHEELKQEYQVNLKKFKESQQQEGEAHRPIKTEDALATSPENKEGNQLQCAESAMESDEAMETAPQEVKDPSLCVNQGCTNKAVFEKDRGPQYCSNECVVMDTRNVFVSWIRNRKVRQ